MNFTPSQLHSLSAVQQHYMQFLYDTMPASDRASYPFELFLSFVNHALFLRENVAWCASLSEEDFKEFVLYHRINNEDLSNPRPLFYKELYHRIQNLPIDEALLEANRWCQQNVTYQSQDIRTASAATVYNAGSGRCGEQSVFAVTVLRSVGIAARQVYVPRWSHCDDNHAWVEALCNGQWVFFGACEPEPVLNRGWFNTAASRALLVHSRSFAGLDSNSEKLDYGRGLTFYNQTHRYAKTQHCAFSVMQNGKPAANALLHLEVLNEAALAPIASFTTDESGTVALSLGMGDVVLHAIKEEWEGYALFSGAAQSTAVVELKAPAYSTEWQAFDQYPPEDSLESTILLTAQQKEQRTQDILQGTTLRETRIENFFNPQLAAFYPHAKDILRMARGNFAEVHAFLSRDDNPLRLALLRTLSHKDYRDLTAEVLEQHLASAPLYDGKMPAEVYKQCLLCPRIGFERLTAWRALLPVFFSAGQQQEYTKNPAALWQYLLQNITAENNFTNATLLFDPVDALRQKTCNTESLSLLFVAVLRALGIPARLNPLDNVPEFWIDNAFARAEAPANSTLILQKDAEAQFINHQNWSLARHTACGWQTLPLTGCEWEEDTLTLCLPAGLYRLLTSTRLPSGTQYAYHCCVVTTAGQQTRVKMQLRSFDLKATLKEYALPAFPVIPSGGAELASTDWLPGKTSLLFWLEEGMEPTEHVLNELIEAKEELAALPYALCFFVRNQSSLQQRTLAYALQQLPFAQVVYGDWPYTVELLSRRLYCDPDRPPLSIVCNAKGNAVYACNGYNVGTVRQLIEITATL